MLILSRRKDEKIIIDDSIEVKIIEVHGDQVKIGITAPALVRIFRYEVYVAIQEENTLASQNAAKTLSQLHHKIKGKI